MKTKLKHTPVPWVLDSRGCLMIDDGKFKLIGCYNVYKSGNEL